MHNTSTALWSIDRAIVVNTVFVSMLTINTVPVQSQCRQGQLDVVLHCTVTNRGNISLFTVAFHCTMSLQNVIIHSLSTLSLYTISYTGTVHCHYTLALYTITVQYKCTLFCTQSLYTITVNYCCTISLYTLTVHCNGKP